ncbi:MAG: SDR family oxidoreductase [Chloroflexota bacterium]|nr:SDR family oxidoreductase [Chloroflexota bacterium]
MQLKPIAQQVVVVVGASSGIGRETAVRFAKHGAKVVIAARSEPGLGSLINEIRRAGGEVTAITADVAEFAQVKAIADRAVQEYGRIDTWVHLASVAVWGTFEQTTPAEFKRIIDVNLTGQAYGAMTALPHLRRAGRGALIHVSSIEGKLALPLQSAYSASKHGVVGFLDALRLELQHEGIPISVTNVMPSSINTPFFNKAGTKLGVQPRPLPPMYQPQLVADAILYAAEHPTRDLVVGGAGKAGIELRRMSPRLMDAFLRLTAFTLQRTDAPKSEDAPNNLFQPVAGYDQVEGDFGKEARAWSVYTWLELHPHVRRLVTSTALSAIMVVAARVFRKGE